jgi:hypothetical protein
MGGATAVKSKTRFRLPMASRGSYEKYLRSCGDNRAAHGATLTPAE